MSFLTLALLATDAWFTMDEDATETQVQSFLLIPADNVAMEHPPLPVVRRSSASGDRFGRGSLSLNHLEAKAFAFQHMPATFLFIRIAILPAVSLSRVVGKKGSFAADRLAVCHAMPAVLPIGANTGFGSYRIVHRAASTFVSLTVTSASFAGRRLMIR